MGEMGCISFNGNKILTCGGGGMILTNSDEYSRQAKYLSTQAKDDPFNFLHHEIGFNFRLTNIQAAIGLAQLERIEEIKSKKDKIYKFYQELFSNKEDIDLISPYQNTESNYWLNIIKFLNQELQKVAIKKFISEEIEVRPIWHLNHLQLPYRDSYTYKIENAPVQVATSLCLPSSSGLTDEQLFRVEKVITAL
jgi:perosamine synthetase